VGYNGFRGTVAGRTWERGEFGAGYYRFEADGSSLEYVARTSNNTWGVDESEEGYVFGSTANRRPSVHVAIPARHYERLGLRAPVQPGIEDSPDIFPIREILQVDQFDMYTAGAAHEIYTARAFPEAYWNRAAFVAEPTGHLIGMFDLEPEGTTYVARNRWSFLASRDEWSAPVQVKVGPDGALWVSDFYTLVAQHNPTPEDMMGCCERGPGNAYETPNRDKLHGRIYRIAYEGTRGQTAVAPPRSSLAGASPAELVDALADDNMFWRLTAQRLLVERGETDVVPALVELVADHTVDAQGLNPGALHGLWALHGLGALDASAGAGGPALQAVRNALHHPAASVRRAALIVLPRDGRLLDDIMAAGMLPDRDSPTPVDYTVGSPLLQDAEPAVRIEALLAVAELEGSSRATAAVAEVLFAPRSARDRWMVDAAAMAGAAQGPAFTVQVLERELPDDSASVAGVGRAVELMSRHHATAGDAAAVVPLIVAVEEAHAVLGAAVLEGIADGWPEEQQPTLTAEQRAALQAAAAGAPGLAEGFAALAERWGDQDLFSGGGGTNMDRGSR
jgi:hypothetical protein